MQRNTRNLLTTLVGAGALVLAASAPSFALDLPQKYKMDMGPLGTWSIVGGLEAELAGWNNAPHTCNGNGLSGNCSSLPGTHSKNDPAAPLAGGGSSTTGDLNLTNAIFIISNDSLFGLPLSFDAWIGEPPQTPVIGYTSANVAPNLYSSGGWHGLNNTGAASFCFKCNVTWAPGFAPWFSLSAGRLPSPDGTEVGVGWFNALPFLSDLNNMQTTVADGAQVNFSMPGDNSFYWGFVPGYASTLSIRIADGYKTGHMNELGFTGLWNLTPDGSDFIVAYGHTRLSTVGNATTVAKGPPGASTTNYGGVNPYAVGGFGTFNSNLIGVGTVFNLTNRLVMNAEVETQWLPQSDIPVADRCGTTANPCDGKSQQDYYRWSTQWTFAYDFGIKQIGGAPVRVGFAVQPSFTYQHGNTSDPNGNQFGNYLGLNVSDLGSNAGGDVGTFGTFGQGSKMWAIQFGPSFQMYNAFVRPTLAWTHLASIDTGFGYGDQGNTHDQVVLMLDFGWLLGKLEKGDTGQ
ncbi:MAG: hypothetical protein KGJ66_06455 [Alphaproteobacteria bacterium]|nr:hypothetical protein [Alphaproteobacteria bacterium]